MSEDNSWRTASFRQNVVQKIDEAIRQSGMSMSRNSVEMENHVFQKAKSKEEYLGFVARLILHVREMNTKKGAGMNPGGAQGGPGMQDPINALQNLAGQGTRNSQMINMGQQFTNIGQQQQVPPNAANILLRGPNQMGNMPGPGMQPRMPMGMVPNTNQMPNQMPPQMPQQMQNSPMAQMPNQMQNMPNQMGTPPQMPVGNMMGQMPMQQQQRKPPEMMMTAPGNAFPRGQGPPNQFPQQSPTQSVQSPAGMTGGPPSVMVASPAMAPSPSAQMNMMSSQRSNTMAPSPSSSLNTPGQPNPSPMGMQDEAAYREKVRQLSKYIEPLTKMIARMGNEGEHVEKTSKMKKLLEILSNPTQRMPLETLLKCERVLEKLDFKRADGSVPPPSGTTTLKEHHAFNPLVEVINHNLQSPVINHTLQRTFGPTLDSLFSPEIKLVPPLRRRKIEEPGGEIPDVLQGEIARLDQRFKVAIDPNQQPGSKTIHLICWLDDKSLPCVPPVSLTVPEDYPVTSPKCHMAPHEYNATQFLSSVQTALLARIKKLPKHFSVSQLLDTWEMSVRQASAPTHVSVCATTLLMGL